MLMNLHIWVDLGDLNSVVWKICLLAETEQSVALPSILTAFVCYLGIQQTFCFFYLFKDKSNVFQEEEIIGH